MNERMFAFSNSLLIGVALLVLFSARAQDKSYQLFSPDRKTEIKIRLQDKIYFSIKHNGQELVSPSPISMSLDQSLNLALYGSPKNP